MDSYICNWQTICTTRSRPISVNNFKVNSRLKEVHNTAYSPYPNNKEIFEVFYTIFIPCMYRGLYHTNPLYCHTYLYISLYKFSLVWKIHFSKHIQPTMISESSHSLSAKTERWPTTCISLLHRSEWISSVVKLGLDRLAEVSTAEHFLLCSRQSYLKLKPHNLTIKSCKHGYF